MSTLPQPAALKSPPPLPPPSVSRAVFNDGDPASLQINSASSSFWNAAIHLLSPLETSPTAIERKEQQQQNQQRGEEANKPIVFKKWKHPAAPFYYEPEKLKPSLYSFLLICRL
ncbi:Uncharacterized protein At4g14450, chloroplastic [Linum perenne]